MKTVLIKLFLYLDRQTRLFIGLSIFPLLNTVFFDKYIQLLIDLRKLKKQQKKSSVVFNITKLSAYYADKKDKAGRGRGAYFHQDLHVAQRIFVNNPNRHIDIGRRIDGFVAHVASFRRIEVFDIRPMTENISNVSFVQKDLMMRDNLEGEIVDSISCLHALEHFGLGRYGDPILYEGYLRGFENITFLLRKEGRFYFSVPMGEQRIEFHAHRVFSLKYLLELVRNNFEVEHFSYVDDKGDFFCNIDLNDTLIESNCGCHFGCAIFELIKK